LTGAERRSYYDAVEAALIKAISAIHRSDSLDDFESAFIGQGAIQAPAFGIYLLNPRLPIPRKFFGTGAPRAFLEEYDESYRALDPIYDFVVRERSVGDGAHVLGGREWRTHPLRRWLCHWGWQHSLQGPVLIRGEVAGTVNFARGADGGAFTERSRRVAQVICEEVSAALEKLLERSEITAELNLFTACFDSAPLPLVICDARGNVRALNWRAKARTDDPLCRVAHVVSELASSSKEALAMRTDMGDTIMSVRLPGCDDLFLSAWDGGLNEASPLEGLPARSREVAELLIQGKQNKWIAWKLGISRDTVKYHVRRVYGVLGVSSRIELVRLATKSPSPGRRR
jgi:DNA-binding CsgD family transcriptional regulator